MKRDTMIKTLRIVSAAGLVGLGLLASACGEGVDPAATGPTQMDGFDPDPSPQDVGAPDLAEDPPMDAARPPDKDDVGQVQDLGTPDVEEEPDPEPEPAPDQEPEPTPDPEPDAQPDPEPASHLNIDILGALLGPGKVDRSEWDGVGNVPDEIWLTVAILVEMPVQDVLDWLSTSTVQTLSKPDPYGTVEIDLGGGWEQPVELAARTNTFQPLFDDASYVGLDAAAEMRLKVELWDEDVFLDDPVGAVIISRAQIDAARDAGGSYWVNVASQSNGQIVYVQIAVAEFSN